jgi:hypothetical protein
MHLLLIRLIDSDSSLFACKEFKFALWNTPVLRQKRAHGIHERLIHKVLTNVLLSLQQNSHLHTKLCETLAMRLPALLHGMYQLLSKDSTNGSGTVLHWGSWLHAHGHLSIATEILSIYLLLHPNASLMKDSAGRVPLHYASQSSALTRRSLHNSTNVTHQTEWVHKLLMHEPLACRIFDKSGRLPLHYALEGTEYAEAYEIEQKHQYHFLPENCPRAEIVQYLVFAHPKAVDVPDPVTGLFPFMSAGTAPDVSLNCVYHLLRRSPTVLKAHFG